MSNLEDKLREYLGGGFKEPTRDDIIKATEHLNLGSADGIIRMIEATAMLDIPVTAAFFYRDLSSRFNDVGNIMERIVGKGNKNTPVPHMSEQDIKKAPEYITSAYKDLLREFYELAALLDLSVNFLGESKYLAITIEQWNNYLFFAEGHTDQKVRIEIAQQHLEQLRCKE